ncbi:MAG: hypothetical protein ACRC56_11775 [Bosea sp. (in: a-proteobacteria)]
MRAIYLTLGLALTGAIIWAVGIGNFWKEGAALLAMPWGVVTLVDLYVGFAVAGLFFALFERLPLALGLFLVTLVLGNIVPCAWIVWRAPRLLALLKSQSA